MWTVWTTANGSVRSRGMYKIRVCRLRDARTTYLNLGGPQGPESKLLIDFWQVVDMFFYSCYWRNALKSFFFPVSLLSVLKIVLLWSDLIDANILQHNINILFGYFTFLLENVIKLAHFNLHYVKP